ncbi:MAG: segregation/condensation protein A [Nitrospirota bacterium]|nr:segregation/condensation protein A [Nitrospirota bacterium]
MDVKLDIFEGPLDLLLHLIRQHEIDIYDIPIALITRQYLEYIELMKTLNLEIAGEFLVMAATLAQIKSRMLLPVPEPAEGEGEGVDPRQELVNRLLEYKKFKEASEILEERGDYWGRIYQRERCESLPELEKEPELQPELFNFGLFDLMAAFQEILKRHPEQKLREIILERFTVQEKIDQILSLIDTAESVIFETLFDADRCREEVIVTFLAVLELVKQKVVRVYQVQDFGSIYLKRAGEA